MQRNKLERSNDAADPSHRPALTALVAKLEALPSLEGRPEAYEWLIGQLLWRYARRFDSIYGLERLIRSAHLYASQTRPVPGIDDISVTTEDESKSGSLGEEAEVAELPSKIKRKHKVPRNDVTPGPTHKSPVAYSMGGHTGFTIPGIRGQFIWHGPGKPPDMDKVVDILAKGLGLLWGGSPDLKDKKLKKRVRKIIFDHTLEDDLACDCGKKFTILEDWAAHVRKLIWKELKGDEG